MDPLTPAERRLLLGLARQALEARVRGDLAPQVPQGGALDAHVGAFVSIHRHDGELRGCLGRLEPLMPLSEVVAHLAAVVADSDPRFEPVAPDEIEALDIEISVLTPEREIVSVDEIEVGRHGLVVEEGPRRGLLLPQVPVGLAWDRQTFVEHTCLKAGLPADAWRSGARLLVFEADVFAESDPR